MLAVLEGLMRKLPKVIDKGPPTKLRVSGSKLIVNMMAIEVTPLAESAPTGQAAPIVMATNATTLQVAMLEFSHSPAEIERAGCARQVNAAKKRRAECCEAAAKKLEWLGIDAKLIAGWVEGHLRAGATETDS